jgi:hypothetical protein
VSGLARSDELGVPEALSCAGELSFVVLSKIFLQPSFYRCVFVAYPILLVGERPATAQFVLKALAVILV